MFAYLAQCRCDPANTILYFSQFYNIVDTMKERGASPPEILELLVAEERSRSRFTDADLHKSLELLGFGKGNILDIELDDDVSDNFVIQAWKDAQKRAWQEPSDKAATLRSDLNDALKIVADFKDSPTLLRAWERGKAPVMTEDTAYSTLEVPKEVDETMLLTIFNLRVRNSHCDTFLRFPSSSPFRLKTNPPKRTRCVRRSPSLRKSGTASDCESLYPQDGIVSILSK